MHPSPSSFVAALAAPTDGGFRHAVDAVLEDFKLWLESPEASITTANVLVAGKSGTFDFGLFYRASVLLSVDNAARMLSTLPGVDPEEVAAVNRYFHARFMTMVSPAYATAIASLAAFNFLPSGANLDPGFRSRERQRLRTRRAAQMRIRSVDPEEIDPASPVDRERLALEVDRVSGLVVDLEARREEAQERIQEIIHSGHEPTSAERQEIEELHRRVAGIPAALATQQRRLDRLRAMLDAIAAPHDEP